MFAAKLIKADRWWNDKATPVLGIAYCLLAIGDRPVPLVHMLGAMLAFMIAFVGVAGFGHVVNDAFDVEHDRLASKFNAWQWMTEGRARWLLPALLLLAWLPWLFLPANRWNLSFIALQLALLTAYAAPPWRLKERPLGGVATDALYAYAVPALITWTTFGPLAGVPGSRWILLAAMLLWSVCAGLRGILNHQCVDAETDARAGLTTFATTHGSTQTMQFIANRILPAEWVAAAVMTITLSREFPLYPLGVALFLVWRLFQLVGLSGARVTWPWRLEPRSRVRLYGFDILGEFQTKWFPVYMVAALAVRQPATVVVALAHLACFNTGIIGIFHYDRHTFRRGLVRVTGAWSRP
jgi:4-hydroxybenzoate polyprenyltransferase